MSEEEGKGDEIKIKKVTSVKEVCSLEGLDERENWDLEEGVWRVPESGEAWGVKCKQRESVCVGILMEE